MVACYYYYYYYCRCLIVFLSLFPLLEDVQPINTPYLKGMMYV